MITLPYHTSCVLQPLNIYCFKSFTITFKKVRDATMSINNHMKLDKITLVRWVYKVLKPITDKKKTSSLNLRLHVYCFSTPRQWITRLDP
jgi:hypothetical protein